MAGIGSVTGCDTAVIMPALALPAVKEKFALQGIEPMPLSPAEIDALIRREVLSNIAIAKAAKLKFD